MSSNQRSNWTQFAKNQSITKDHAGAMAYRATQFADRGDPVQCAHCCKLVKKNNAVKLVSSRDHVCIQCMTK